MTMTRESSSTVPPKSYSLGLACTFVFILCLSYMFNSAVRQVFPMLLPWVSKTYGFSLQSAGLLSTIFSVGSLAAGIPIGYILDRFPRKTVMELGLGVYSIFTLLTTQASGFWSILIFLAISGVGEGMQIAGIYSIIGSYFTRTRTRALSALVIAYGLGGFIGPQLGTKLTVLFNDNWRIPLIVLGIAGLVMVFVVQFFVPKNFTENKGQGGSAMTDEAAISHIPKNLWNRNVILCSVAAIITGFSLFGFVSLYATYLIKVLKYAPMNASYAFSFFGIGGIMSIVGGWCGDRFKQKWVIAVSFICAAVVSYLTYNVATAVGVQALLSFLIGTFCSGFLYLNVSAMLQRSVRPEMIGRASGIFVSSIYLAAALAGWLFARLVAAFGWGGAAVIELCIFPAIGVIAMLMVNQDQLITVKPKKISTEKEAAISK